jgi:hypothetical protein
MINHSRISPRIFEKIRNGPNGILRGPRDTVYEKNLKAKISCQIPFKDSKIKGWYLILNAIPMWKVPGRADNPANRMYNWGCTATSKILLKR